MFKHFSWNQSTELSRKLNSNTIDAIHRISQCAPTEDGRTRVECRFENESIWLTQKLMAELFQKDVRTVNEHIQNVFAEAALSPDSVIRKFRITAADGKTYETQHYSIEMILAVGYRVKSPRGTQFRQWATARLSEFLLKGFVIDDERLKNPPGAGVPDYFITSMNCWSGSVTFEPVNGECICESRTSWRLRETTCRRSRKRKSSSRPFRTSSISQPQARPRLNSLRNVLTHLNPTWDWPHETGATVRKR